MNFNFLEFKREVEKELYRIYNLFGEKYSISSVGIYTDEGALTVSIAINRVEFLNNKESCYKRWIIDEWEFPYIESKVLDEVSLKLYKYVTALEDDSFYSFREKLYRVLIDILKKFRLSIDPNTLLLFRVSDYNNFDREALWVKELNGESIYSDYLECIKLLKEFWLGS